VVANVSEKSSVSEISALLTQKSTTLQVSSFAHGTPCVYNPVFQSLLSRSVDRITYLKPVAYRFLGRGEQLNILCVGLVFIRSVRKSEALPSSSVLRFPTHL